jgi:cell division protein FtsB
MIQINLLPPEYRPRTGTPVVRFVAIVVGVVLIASATGAWFYTHFIQLSNVLEIRDVLTEEATTKDQQKQRSLALQSEIDLYEKRRTAIQTVNRSRTLWSRKLDQFYDIITQQDDTGAYKVWLDTIEVPPQKMVVKSRGRRRKGAQANGGTFRFTGFMAMDSQSDAPALSSLLFRALTGDPEATGERTEFFKDFLAINNPNVSVVKRTGAEQEEELLPPIVATYRYELLLKPPEKPGKRGAKSRGTK